MEVHRHVLSLGALCWAAAGKDPGSLRRCCSTCCVGAGRVRPEDVCDRKTCATGRRAAPASDGGAGPRGAEARAGWRRWTRPRPSSARVLQRSWRSWGACTTRRRSSGSSAIRRSGGRAGRGAAPWPTGRHATPHHRRLLKLSNRALQWRRDAHESHGKSASSRPRADARRREALAGPARTPRSTRREALAPAPREHSPRSTRRTRADAAKHSPRSTRRPRAHAAKPSPRSTRREALAGPARTTRSTRRPRADAADAAKHSQAPRARREALAGPARMPRSTRREAGAARSSTSTISSSPMT